MVVTFPIFIQYNSKLTVPSFFESFPKVIVPSEWEVLGSRGFKGRSRGSCWEGTNPSPLFSFPTLHPSCFSHNLLINLVVRFTADHATGAINDVLTDWGAFLPDTTLRRHWFWYLEVWRTRHVRQCKADSFRCKTEPHNHIKIGHGVSLRDLPLLMSVINFADKCESYTMFIWNTLFSI